MSDRRHHQFLLRRLDAGVPRDGRRGNRCLRQVQLMRQDAAAGTEFQSRLGEDAVLRERPGADAGDRVQTARLAVAVRKAEKELLPLELRAAATRDAALPGAALRERLVQRRPESALSALPFSQAFLF